MTGGVGPATSGCRLGKKPRPAAGIAYMLSWVACVTLPVPNLAVTASGADVIAGYGCTWPWSRPSSRDQGLPRSGRPSWRPCWP